MENIMEKSYDFNNAEKRIYEKWEEKGYFKPTNDPNFPDHDPSIKPFVISIPPPNVTGELHLGHALFVSMEDLMIRYHRMKGIPTLWVPGTDHAGIATQLQVEKHLLKTEEVTREELGREEFLERMWDWKKKYKHIMTEQIRRLGASCDWDRERFTLDNGLSDAVKTSFVSLYNKGLIYRGPRLINWSPGLKTAVSDLEVEYHEEQGKLYHFKYMIADSDEFIPVATTRPETILGDTAVAVHPDDPRYQKFISKKALVPMLGREIPIIADDYVDREFGTGALKITPGHDPNDYEIGQRHNLDVITVMDKEARINHHGGQYQGLDRETCRKQIWVDMQEAGLVIKTEDYTHQVPRSQRGGDIIEPMVSTQWFVKIKPMADAAIEAVRSGQVKIIPEFFNKVYFNWMENIRDWCISRQLWWGHRIPVWYGPDGEQFCAFSEEEAYEQAKEFYSGDFSLEQDPDVLDTWFSSALWPFSSLGWPRKTPDLDYFYPTSVLETGYDILFFWVSRMIMSGLEYTNEAPFHTVYLHGLVRDENGQKMSKSKGNVIDPLVVMDQFGTDALRFTLLVGSSPGKDMNLSLDKVKSNRNFANKLWNATRLVLSLLDKTETAPEHDTADWALADSWIWAKLKKLTNDVDRLFSSSQFGEAGRHIYEFFYTDFADWYLEIAKIQVEESGARARTTTDTLVRVLDMVLRMLHPYTPFVTEELWGFLKDAALEKDIKPPQSWEDALIIAKWPEPLKIEGWEDAMIADFEKVQGIIRSIRNLRSEKSVKAGHKIPAVIVAGKDSEMIKNNSAVLSRLAHLDIDGLSIIENLDKKLEGHVSLIVGTVEIHLPLSELVNKEEEISRLNKELTEVSSHIKRLEGLLGGAFAEKAPPNVVQNEREKLAAYKDTADKITKQLSEL
jgi:valyl-tRNA synthetase